MVHVGKENELRQFLKYALAAALAVLLAPSGAVAQEASAAEEETITHIAQCMMEGLPDDWVAAHMVVELPSAGADSGGVRYLVARKDAEDNFEPFNPCDTAKPAQMLVDLRASQPRERQGWTSARLVIERDGSFRLNYDFP
jgi:hypothetical protein